jgi:hypothetical protein
MERMIARQRARIAFLKDGDANMAFFHLQCSHRRQKNKINSVVSEQRVLMEHADMAENAFSHLLGTDVSRHVTLDLDELIAPSDGLDDLGGALRGSEDLGRDKALACPRPPGLYGFTAGFLCA